tara:strand:- start:107 stop:313 length:207 start_codon:yes stop_codon:yes gene_type:complete
MTTSMTDMIEAALYCLILAIPYSLAISGWRMIEDKRRISHLQNKKHRDSDIKHVIELRLEEVRQSMPK